MTTILNVVLFSSLFVHIVLMGVSLWRTWRGENVIDRLIAVDLLGILTLAVLVIISIIERDSVFIDVALGLAALGFVSTLALAKYIADEQMF
ncbi:MAG: hypothetical protein J5I90_20485 [Caldilineales bacterium]|nr:hypothetical protein [Caldilineales bacterium]